MKQVNSLYNGKKQYFTVRFSTKDGQVVNVQVKEKSDSPRANRGYGFAERQVVDSSLFNLFAGSESDVLGFEKKSLARTGETYTQALVRTNGSGLKWQIPAEDGADFSNIPYSNRRENYVSFTTPEGVFPELTRFLEQF